MKNEYERLEFLEATRGKPEALDFAKRTYIQYKRALKTPYGRSYRRSLIESILVFRKYIREKEIWHFCCDL